MRSCLAFLFSLILHVSVLFLLLHTQKPVPLMEESKVLTVEIFQEPSGQSPTKSSAGKIISLAQLAPRWEPLEGTKNIATENVLTESADPIGLFKTQTKSFSAYQWLCTAFVT